MDWGVGGLVGLALGFFLGAIASMAHSMPRIQDLKQEADFWRKQSEQERDRADQLFRHAAGLDKKKAN